MVTEVCSTWMRRSRLSWSYLVIVSQCLFFGCRDGRQEAVMPAAVDLQGVWMISEKSLAELRDDGLSVFTNQADHVLRLNPDGSCEYCGLSRYWQVDSPSNEHRNYTGRCADDRRLGAKTNDWPVSRWRLVDSSAHDELKGSEGSRFRVLCLESDSAPLLSAIPWYISTTGAVLSLWQPTAKGRVVFEHVKSE